MITLFGIKNCDTVKKARYWLKTENIDFRFHDFRTDGVSIEQITEWSIVFGLKTLINKRGSTWKCLSDTEKILFTKEDTYNKKHLITLITSQPTLIKRPLLDTTVGYYLGFSDKKYQALFKGQI